jgi:hypothetical protein
MPLQILTLKLDGITAGDYLTWCRDPDPPTLGDTLRTLHVGEDVERLVHPTSAACMTHPRQTSAGVHVPFADGAEGEPTFRAGGSVAGTEVPDGVDRDGLTYVGLRQAELCTLLHHAGPPEVRV